MQEYGEPKNPSSPSSIFQHVGHGVSFGLMEGMEYGTQRLAYKEIRQQRLDSRPLYKIAISDRRVHAAEYDDRRRRDIRNRMRDRAELKSFVNEWGEPRWVSEDDFLANLPTSLLVDEYIWVGDEEGIEG